MLEVSKTHLLAADHPAAEGSVAAEQRGAQQQRDHAAHRGAVQQQVLRGARAASAGAQPATLAPQPPCLLGPTPAAGAQLPDPLRASPLAGTLPPAAPVPRVDVPGWSSRLRRCAFGGLKLGGPVYVPEAKQKPRLGPHRYVLLFSPASDK